LLVIKSVGQDGNQHQFHKVDAMEEHNWHIASHEVKGFKDGQMYNGQECILQFATEVIPIWS